MIDLSDCSMSDLTEIEKAIKCRKNELKTKELSKEQLRDDTRVIDFLEKRFPNRSNWVWNEKLMVHFGEIGLGTRTKILNSMFTLCDIALKNYKDQGHIARQNRLINRNSLQNYQNMWDDLWEVFIKYADLEVEGEKNEY